MPYTVYRSKLYDGACLLFILLFAGGVSLFWARMPWGAQAVFGVLIGLAGLSCLWGLLSLRPALRVDETGITYAKLFFPRLTWEDVLHVRRLPKTWTLKDGRTFTCLREEWRPVEITVARPEHYLRRMPGFLRRNFLQPDQPDQAVIRIEFTGLAGNSADLEAAVLSHLAQRPKARTPAG